MADDCNWKLWKPKLGSEPSWSTCLLHSLGNCMDFAFVVSCTATLINEPMFKHFVFYGPFFFSIFCWCLVWITYVKMRLTYWHLPLLLNLNLSDFWCLLYLFYKFGSPTIQFINIYSNHISSTSCRGLLYLFCLSWSQPVFSFPLLGSLISMGDCVWGTFLGDHR